MPATGHSPFLPARIWWGSSAKSWHGLRPEAGSSCPWRRRRNPQLRSPDSLGNWTTDAPGGCRGPDAPRSNEYAPSGWTSRAALRNRPRARRDRGSCRFECLRAILAVKRHALEAHRSQTRPAYQPMTRRASSSTKPNHRPGSTGGEGKCSGVSARVAVIDPGKASRPSSQEKHRPLELPRTSPFRAYKPPYPLRRLRAQTRVLAATLELARANRRHEP